MPGDHHDSGDIVVTGDVPNTRPSALYARGEMQRPQGIHVLTVQMGGDRDLLLRLLSSPLGLAILASGHAGHVNTTNLRLALMDRWVKRSFENFNPT